MLAFVFCSVIIDKVVLIDSVAPRARVGIGRRIRLSTGGSCLRAGSSLAVPTNMDKTKRDARCVSFSVNPEQLSD